MTSVGGYISWMRAESWTVDRCCCFRERGSPRIQHEEQTEQVGIAVLDVYIAVFDTFTLTTCPNDLSELRWVGHVVRATLANIIVQGNVAGEILRGKPTRQWLDNVNEWTDSDRMRCGGSQRTV